MKQEDWTLSFILSRTKKTIEMKCILGVGETHGLTQKWAFGQTADLKKNTSLLEFSFIC